MITTLIVYHATCEYHKGHEIENIHVARELCRDAVYLTYQEYLTLCDKNGVAPYNESTWDNHINGIAHKY